jgi:hypothetical protein
MKYLVKMIRFIVNALIIAHAVMAQGQSHLVLDKIPLDTTKWSATDTIYFDLNNDKVQDAILIFDKFKSLTRPNGIQTPILFYFGTKSNVFTFVSNANRLIAFPDYKFEILGNDLAVTQTGIRNDNKEYILYCKYTKSEIIVYREVVKQKISKIKVENKKVISLPPKINIIYDKLCSKPVKSFNLFDLVNRWQ